MAVEESASGNASPKTSRATNKIKFFCSNGGMILPRPSDGRLKYVGGETRVISAPRNVSFSDLMRKINHMFEGEFILKYQIGPEELDALVSVKSDEELHYMFDEYDGHERGGTSKLRTFLFTTKPTMIESQSPTASTPLQSLEQRYVDALNGIVRPTNYHNHFASARRSSRLKSMCSSPSECLSPCSVSPRSVVQNSPINAVDAANFISSLNGKLNSMTRVHSSPSLNSLANQNVQLQPSNNSHNQESHHIVYPGYQSSSLHHPHQQQQQLSSYNNNHMGRAHDWVSPMREDYGRVPSISAVPSPGHCRPFHKGGSGGHNRWAHPGQYASGYSTSSHRAAGVHSEPRGIIWE